MLLSDLESSVGEYYNIHKKEFHLVQKDTKLLTDLTQANQEVDIHHIDYDIPENVTSKKREYMQFLGKECMLYKIIHAGSVYEWRELLSECIKLEGKK